MSKPGSTRNTTDEVYSLPLRGRQNIDVSEAYSALRAEDTNKKLFMTVTTGRSGVKWLHEIFGAHKNVRVGSERNPTEESFYRYIKFHDLPVDVSGVINLTKKAIMKDWERSDVSMIGSPYFSHDFLDVYSALQPDKVIWGINNPKFTVTSFFNKGWYRHEEEYVNHDLACGLQPSHGDKLHHSFSRIVPRQNFYHEWNQLTRVGKISWFLNTVNMDLWSGIKHIPRKNLWVFRLEDADQNYSYYEKLNQSFSLIGVLSRDEFLSLKKTASNAKENVEHDWSEAERLEFEKFAKDYIELYTSNRLDDVGYMSAVLDR